MLAIVIIYLIGANYVLFRYACAIGPARTDVNEPAGFEGWLLFFVFLLLFVGPAVQLGATNSSLEAIRSQTINSLGVDVYKNIETVTWSVTTIYIGLGIFAGFALALARKPFAVITALIVIWTGFIAESLAGYFFSDVIFSTPSLDVEYIKQVIGSFIFALFWTSYFMKSRRVKNTYFPV